MKYSASIDREPGVLRVGLILSSPSPHQVDLLNAIAAHDDVDAFVGYVSPFNPSRHWGRPTPTLPWENLPCSAGQIWTGKLDRWIATRKPHVWLLSSVYTSYVTHVLVRMLRRRQMPFTFLGEPPQPRQGLHGWLQRRLVLSVLERASGIVGTGLESARRYRRLLNSDRPVISVPYHVEMAHYLESPPIQPPADTEDYRFVASAQLIHRKGLDVLIGACRRLPQTGWSLDIYGEGPLRPELERLCREIDRPVQLRGLLPYDRRHEVFLNKHCFVFSTRWDGWGMVLPEALAMGLPVISTDQAMSAHDFIRDGENGQIVPADNEEILASAMRRAIASRSLLTRQSIAAKNSLRDYTPENGAGRLIRFLGEVAGKAA